MATAVVVVLTMALPACGGGGSGDVDTFCASVRDLRTQDPFADLAVASPEEMRDAFDELSTAADRVAEVAPDSADAQASAYRAAVRALVDQLRGAGFDPRAVDALRYRQAVGDYTDAAVSLDNTATSVCR